MKGKVKIMEYTFENFKDYGLTRKQLLETFKVALDDYNALKLIVNNASRNHLGLENLCDCLGGHNLEENLFDLNYGAICATITQEDLDLTLSNSFEIWSSIYQNICDDLLVCDMSYENLVWLIENYKEETTEPTIEELSNLVNQVFDTQMQKKIERENQLKLKNEKTLKDSIEFLSRLEKDYFPMFDKIASVLNNTRLSIDIENVGFETIKRIYVKTTYMNGPQDDYRGINFKDNTSNGCGYWSLNKVIMHKNNNLGIPYEELTDLLNHKEEFETALKNAIVDFTNKISSQERE